MIQLFALWTAWLTAAHPFHVSVTQMEYKAETKAIQIASKVFLDDLEEAYNAHYHTDVDLWELRDDELTDERLGEFFKSYFKISVNGKEMELVYLGKEMDLDATWAYFEIYKVRRIREMEISNRIALDQFDDQVNLVHMEYQDEAQTVRCDRSKTSDTMSFED